MLLKLAMVIVGALAVGDCYSIEKTNLAFNRKSELHFKCVFCLSLCFDYDNTHVPTWISSSVDTDTRAMCGIMCRLSEKVTNVLSTYTTVCNVRTWKHIFATVLIVITHLPILVDIEIESSTV